MLPDGIKDTKGVFNVLCGCGWGRLNCPEAEIPLRCPVCNNLVRQGLDDSGEEIDFYKVRCARGESEVYFDFPFQIDSLVK